MLYGIREGKDMVVYRSAYEISLDIHTSCFTFPKYETFSLADQMRRASRSICANLNEGFARQSGSKKDFRRFVLMAEGSCSEMLVWIDYCRDLKYVSDDKHNEWANKYKHIRAQLSSLRNKNMQKEQAVLLKKKVVD